jgi:hypothetical protein
MRRRARRGAVRPGIGDVTWPARFLRDTELDWMNGVSDVGSNGAFESADPQIPLQSRA